MGRDGALAPNHGWARTKRSTTFTKMTDSSTIPSKPTILAKTAVWRQRLELNLGLQLKRLRKTLDHNIILEIDQRKRRRRSTRLATEEQTAIQEV